MPKITNISKKKAEPVDIRNCKPGEVVFSGEGLFIKPENSGYEPADRNIIGIKEAGYGFGVYNGAYELRGRRVRITEIVYEEID